MDNIFQICRSFSKTIQNGRTLRSTYTHMRGELDELEIEIENTEQDRPQGPDGIIGESIDVIACALDIINQATQHMSDSMVEELCSKLMQTKCQKWADNYS